MYTTGLTTVQVRKVLQGSKQYSNSESLTDSMMTSLHSIPQYTSHNLTPSLSIDYDCPSQPKVKRGFCIQYVLCVEIFTCNQEEHSLYINPNDSMEFLINEICNIHKLPDYLTLELFSGNGCPLNVNTYTKKRKF